MVDFNCLEFGPCAGLSQPGPTDPRADVRETTDDAEEPLEVGRLSALDVACWKETLHSASSPTPPPRAPVAISVVILVSLHSRLKIFSADKPSSKAQR